MNSETSTSQLRQPKRNLTINFSHVKCQYGNPIKDLCINKDCKQHNAVMCSDEECQCSLVHDLCFKSQIRNILKAIQSRAGSYKQFQTQITKIFDTAIDKLSQIQQKLLLNYKDLFEMKAYSSLERQLIQLLKSGQCQKITGQLVFEINSNINKRDQLQKPIIETNQSFQKVSAEIMSRINQFQQDIERPLTRLNLFSKSNIISGSQDKSKIIGFLSNKLEGAKLLYQASEHKFDGQKFHQLCDNVESLLILIKTKENKIIGGYTPYSFPSTNRIKIVEDQKFKSFLFSLTEGEKLTLNNPEYALINYAIGSEYVLSFGHDLKITNKANENSKSLTSLSFSYKNENYPHNQKGWKRFTGSQTHFFGIIQWQAWKIAL